jgi:tRNA-dihydrouridine synthase
MDGVTDQPFRHLVKKYSNPDLIYTEFTSVEGLCHAAKVLLRQLLYDESQRPIIAQLYGKTPAAFRQIAVLVAELGFDGIDLNMGCPAKTVASHGAGAALIKNPKLAQKIIKATQAGIEDCYQGKHSRDCADISQEIWQEVEKKHQALPKKYQAKRKIPVSIKTRIGFDRVITKDWLSTLLETQPAAIALHGRTLRQAYKGQANWQEIGRAVKLAQGTGTFILGNGDLKSRQEALVKAKEYGVAGVLIARASLGNPFVFLDEAQPAGYSKQGADAESQPAAPRQQRSIFKIALEHARLYEKTFAMNEKYSFLPMRKHLAWYIKGIKDASRIRQELVLTNSADEVEMLFKKFV